MTDDELRWIQNILARNANKSFVKRILNPDKFPVLKNEDGSVSTHSMATMEMDGKHYAYPTVLMTKEGLKRFEGGEAARHAIKTGNVIEFPTAADALRFSKKYKRIWGDRKWQ